MPSRARSRRSTPVLGALQRFDASSNALAGAMPSLAGLTALEYVDVGSNDLTGNLPSLAG